MKASNLLPPLVVESTPATPKRRVIPPTTYADELRRERARIERRRRTQETTRKALEAFQAAEAAKAEQTSSVPPEPIEPLPEPEGLVPPEPSRFPREPQRLVEHWARTAERVAANRAAFMRRERQRLETMTLASNVQVIFAAMRAAFEACGVDDESIFDRLETGTYCRNIEAVKRRRAVFMHMHYHGGVSWSDIARAFGVAHSVVMSCRRPLKR